MPGRDEGTAAAVEPRNNHKQAPRLAVNTICRLQSLAQWWVRLNHAPHTEIRTLPAGREWRPHGTPEEVRVHDFIIKELGRAVPYGVYDIAANAGWVSLGINNDTATFAVETIRRWWYGAGRIRYPEAKYLVITADGGGSNGSRVKLWKRELYQLAREIGIEIKMHHLPPGTSKWNKIEHRLFSYISQNWRATPLVSYRVIVDLISATTTKTGLTVHCELDDTAYPKGINVSDEDMDAINMTRADFHGEWNYTIRPGDRSDRAVDS